MDYEALGKSFVEHYYRVFDTNRAGLVDLYRENSMLTFENEKFMGQQAILQKLQSLNFQQVQHQVTVLDCQPTFENGAIVFVVGQLKVDMEAQPLQFSQVFCLRPLPDGSGSFYCHNDMFRLNLH
eukprot:Nk52_evm1s731 gene=Nk52_evmTU1s731